MRKITKWISSNHGIVLIIFTIFAFITPNVFTWVTSTFIGQPVINILLGIIMFGMGVTLSVDDFKLVLEKPIDILKAGFFQFTIMPLLAFILSKVFRLEEALMVGVVLVGTCPGGTASNVITYLAGGDVALSVAMTTFSTIMAPILTPFITYLLIGQSIKFNPVGMFISIMQIVILPIALGLGIKKLFEKGAEKFEDYMPAVSSIMISCVVAGIISANKEPILSSIGIIIAVVVIHNISGFILGYFAGIATGMGHKKSVTLSIEVALQNSGLASSLAATHFPTMTLATIPGALFSAWQNIAGSIFAWMMKRKEEKEEIVHEG